MWKIFGAVRKNLSKNEKFIKYNVIDVSKIVISEEPIPPADGRDMGFQKVRFFPKDQNVVISEKEAIEDIEKGGKTCQSFQPFELEDWNTVADKQAMSTNPCQNMLVDENINITTEMLNKQMVGTETPKLFDKNGIEEHSVEKETLNFKDKTVDIHNPILGNPDSCEVVLKIKNAVGGLGIMEGSYQPFELQDWDMEVDEFATEAKPAQKLSIYGEMQSDMLQKDTLMDSKEEPKVLDTNEINDFANETKTAGDKMTAVHFSNDECDYLDIKRKLENPPIKNSVECLADANNEYNKSKHEYKTDLTKYEMEFSDKLFEGYKKHRGILRIKALKHKCQKYVSYGKIKIFKKRNEKKYMRMPKSTNKDKSNSFKNESLVVENNIDTHECERNGAGNEHSQIDVSDNDNICIHGKVQHGKPIKCAPRFVLSNTMKWSVENLCSDIKNMAEKIATRPPDICQKIPHLQHNCKEIAPVHDCETGIFNEKIILSNGKKKNEKKMKSKKCSKNEVFCCEEIEENGKNEKPAKNGGKLKLKWFRWPRKE